MKKKLLIIALISTSYIFAQQELKLGLGNALVLKTLDISYEHYLNDNSSIGISGLYNFEKMSSDFRYNEATVISPFFRNYFSTDRTWDLFGEVFFSFSSGKKEISLLGAPNTFEKFSDGALGIAAGLKHITESGLIIDVYGGVGRNLFSTNAPTLIPRLGVNLGWRF